MHLLDAARTRFVCIPVINEVAAGIAVEYFNETNKEGNKAFALVTAGPGLTNIVTAIAGAYLESRDLLVIGGQVKRADLKTGQIRQRGIQEIDGQAIVAPITNCSVLINEPLLFGEIRKYLYSKVKPGPVFLEVPLDVQAEPVDYENLPIIEQVMNVKNLDQITTFVSGVVHSLKNSKRPILLLGGGLSRTAAAKFNNELKNGNFYPKIVEEF
jgi:acetolactate synthase-1/2/3 large subunit